MSHTSISIILIFVSILLLTSNCPAQIIYFIQGQPRFDQEGLIPYETIIWEFDESKGTLTSKWEYDKDAWVYGIQLYYSNRIIFIIAGRYEGDELYVISMDSIEPITSIDLKDYQRFAQAKLLVYEDTLEIAEIVYRNVENGSSVSPRLRTFINIGNPGNSLDSELVIDRSRLILSGPLPPLGSGDDDGELIRIGDNNNLVKIYDIVGLGSKDIAKYTGSFTFDKKRGWALCANEKGFAAMLSIPSKHGLVNRDVLVYNRLNSEWSHFKISGPKTTLRPINGWLVGEVAYINPNTNFEKGLNFSPIPGDSAVFINPLDKRYIEVQLGDSCEVLWIDSNDNIYYHIKDKLYKANISEKELIGRKLILKDERVELFHWAFE